MEDTGYTIVDWLSTGLAVCTVLISFLGYLYFKARLETKELKNKNDELTEKYTSLKNDYDKLKEGHTIHEVRVIGAKPIGVSAKLALPDFKPHHIMELTVDTKIELAQRLGVYCMENNYIHFEENYDPMHNATRLSAYLSVASNNEEIVNVLKPDPILAIDMYKVRELSAGFNCYRRGNESNA